MTMESNDVLAIAGALGSGADASDEELQALAASTDILGLAMIADDVRRVRHASAVTYVRVADVRMPAGADTPSIPPAAREVRVMLPAGLPDEHLAGLRRIVDAAGAVPVSAGSLAALESAARTAGRPLADIGRMLRDSGVTAIAEAPLDLLAEPEACFEAMRACQLEVARVTVSQNGDVSGRIRLLRRLRAVQRATGLVRSFAPLARSWNAAAPSTGYEDARHVVISRLFAADVPSIQVDWALYGPKLAQVALTMGADDLDGVSPVDDAPEGRRRAPLEEVLRNIRAAGLTPVERDGRYRKVGE